MVKFGIVLEMRNNMKKLAIIILIILATHLTTIKTIKLIYSDKNVVILESFGIQYEYYKF